MVVYGQCSDRGSEACPSMMSMLLLLSKAVLYAGDYGVQIRRVIVCSPRMAACGMLTTIAKSITYIII